MMDRLTRLEERFEAHQQYAERQFQAMARLHEDNKRLLDKQDERLDKMDVFHARLLTIFAVVVVLANLIAPVILKILRIVP